MKPRNRRVSVRTIEAQGEKPRKPSRVSEVASFLVIVAIAFMFWYAALGGP